MGIEVSRQSKLPTRYDYKQRSPLPPEKCTRTGERVDEQMQNGVGPKKSAVTEKSERPPTPHSPLPLLLLTVCILLSCNRSTKEQAPIPTPAPSARPLAILQTGEYPLWFQLTDEGPVLLETIEDALFSAALVPWPLALHVRFFQVNDGELTMAVNRDGFMKISPDSGTADLALYRFSGGDFWRQYTIGGFVFYQDKPAALLYLDDRFLDSASPFPRPRTWTFNMESNAIFSLNIPALEFFPVDEGWDIDTLRLGHDGFWYYRAGKRNSSQPEVRMLRTSDLSRAGNDVSLEYFQNSAPRIMDASQYPALPPLPEGFVYTGTGTVGGSLFALWEEQEEFNIGASGFLLIRNEE